MGYAVKELYFTLQGEGARTGWPSVFLRFAGCNLWSGREEDRVSAACWFCDTDFRGIDGQGGGRFESAEALASAVAEHWPYPQGLGRTPYVVCTGGEPLLQLDECLIRALHERGFQVGVETNGTLEAPAGIDWLCVSPKPKSKLVITRGHELKLVFPHEITPESVEHLDFDGFYLQPLDGPELERNHALATAYCKAHPQWQLSLQTHKLMGIR